MFMSNTMNKILLQTIVDEDGKIQNNVNYLEILNQDSHNTPDVYFCFLLKTLIDDFSATISEVTKASKKEIEDNFIQNLKLMLGEKTRTSEI